MKSDIVFSAASDEWETPAAIFDALDREFTFELDVAATLENCKMRPFLSPLEDALAVDWAGFFDCDPPMAPICWMNPPYSKVAAFIAKAWAEARKGCTVVCLIPSRTDTRWWHEYVWDRDRHCPHPYVEIRYHKGRIKFVGASAKNSAPFPSVVVIFWPGEVIEWP